MKNGKYTACRTSGAKVFALMLALVLVMGCAIGGTLAWLVDDTDPVVNTFTVGDINIELKEHKYDPATNKLTDDIVYKNDNYKMVPGYTMPKDPYVTVKANSEPCYVFIKVEKSANFDDFMTCEISALFTQMKDNDGEDVDGVYYKTVDRSDTDLDFYILSAPMDTFDDACSNGYVTVKSEVTKAQMEAVGDNKPTIKFTAYAIQKYKSFDVEFGAYEAWTTVSGAATGSTT